MSWVAIRASFGLTTLRFSTKTASSNGRPSLQIQLFNISGLSVYRILRRNFSTTSLKSQETQTSRRSANYFSRTLNLWSNKQGVRFCPIILWLSFDNLCCYIFELILYNKTTLKAPHLTLPLQYYQN